GYAAQPIDEEAYARRLPSVLLNQTLFGLFHDAVRVRRLLADIPIDWAELSRSFCRRLAAGASDTRDARSRIAGMPLDRRVDELISHLRESGDRAAIVLSRALERERRGAAHACRADDGLSPQADSAFSR